MCKCSQECDINTRMNTFSLQDEALKMLENFEEYFAPSPAPLSEKNVVTRHSSMAPRADMLNFGPLCTGTV